MKQTTFRLCFALLISWMSFSLSPACAWDPAWDSDFYRFFDPETSELEGYEPFHFTWKLLYDYDWNTVDAERKDNLEEWKSYFGSSIPSKDIEEVVYSWSAQQLEQLATGSSIATSNQLAQAFMAGKHRDAAKYLSLAKQCEPYNRFVSRWSDEEKETIGSADHQLVRDLKAGYQSADSDYLKMRYAFQIVRLLHYAGLYQDAKTAYEELATPLQHVNSIMLYWTMGQYAGAIHGMEDHLTSSYLFSRVFDKCPSQRVQAWYSFDVRSDQDWQTLLSMCKNDEERANLYFMRAISPEAVGVDEIEKIQQFLPNSEKVDLLLVREINKLEEKLLGRPFDVFYEDTEVKAKPANLAAVSRLVSNTLSAGTAHNPQLWTLARAYLLHLDGKTGPAQEMLSKIPRSGLQGTRADLIDLSIKISLVDHIDRSVENDITKDFYNLKDELNEEQVAELISYRDEHFGLVYRAQGDPGKAVLALNQTWDIIDEISLPVLDDLMKFDRKEKKTLYEKELHQRLKDNYSYWDLLEMKGTALFRKNLLPEAIAAFEKLPEKHRNESRFFTIGPDPFANRVHDEINCEPGCIEKKFTKLSLAKTMLELQKKAVKEPTKAAQYHLMLGNAFFNLSYYGPCWKGMDYFRGYSWRGGANSTNVQDLSLAKSHYKKAAEKAGNPEIGALATLMAAKCEVVRDNGFIPEYLDEYESLRSDYRNTEVYDMAISECRFFYFYVNR